MKRYFGIAFIVLGAVTGFSWLYSYEHYSAINPSVPVSAEGKTIEQDNHGHIFYIDEKEDALLWHLILATFVLLPMGGLLIKD